MTSRSSPKRALLLISFAVLAATSVWFSGTAAAPILSRQWNLDPVQASWLTVSVQLGFILGTFFYAFLNLADIFPARRVFFVSSLLAACSNSAFILLSQGLGSALGFRMLTGMTLAGIYPVAMKIIAQWYRSGLGWRLGIMLGALTAGTATPYFLLALGRDIAWQAPMLIASGLSLAGGLAVLLAIADGPYLRHTPKFSPQMMLRIFKIPRFRYQALGYFGHMWELYAFWSLVAAFVASAFSARETSDIAASPNLLTGTIIGIGAIGCLLGGWFSRSAGEKNIAMLSLLVSGALCFSSGWLYVLPAGALLTALLLWGFCVISDSPQFSALAALSCPPEYTGTALTVQNGIGFSFTLISIPLTAWIAHNIGWRWAFTILGIGPLLGILALKRFETGPSKGSDSHRPSQQTGM